MVAVIDTCASRGTFKQVSTIGRLREILIAESQTQAARQQVAEQQLKVMMVVKQKVMKLLNQLVDAREKIKRSKGKK